MSSTVSLPLLTLSIFPCISVCIFQAVLFMQFLFFRCRCKGLILLETYSTLSGDELKNRLPEFLDISKEVTGDPRYSMFNLSLKERWANNNNFCQNLAGAGETFLEIYFLMT